MSAQQDHELLTIAALSDEREAAVAARPPLHAVPAPAQDDDERVAAVSATPVGAPAWVADYTRRVVVTDVLAVLVAIAVAYVVRIPTGLHAVVSGAFSPSYLGVAVVLFVAWLGALVGGRSRDRRLLGNGSAEYARVAGVSWRLFAVVAVTSYLLRIQVSRGFLAVAFPLGVFLLLVGRYAWRAWLHLQRDRGSYRSPMLVVGPCGKAQRLIEELHRSPRAGYAVIGVCISDRDNVPGEYIEGVPVLGTVRDAARIAVERSVSAVAIGGSDAVTGEVVRTLGWDLEGTGIDMALTLALTDVAGPRVMMQPVSGLPLVYVDEPQFKGARYVVKSACDWLGAALVTVLVSPLLLGVALAVKLTSRGPVLFEQERIGKNGQPFPTFKFRSMYVGAEHRLAEVLAAEGVTEIGAFYKPKNDPRVTPVGRFIRKYSLDELPQLFNVLRGEMSLVGPRPQIAAEVAGYDRAANRRLLVKPGLTGLWQVSGRSNLDPKQAMRLDVQYVENWSMLGDLMLVVRTAKALVGQDAR